METAMSTAPKALFCPTCRKVVLATGEDFPFCSDRCRLLDLGKWASGDSDLLEELARSNAQRHPSGNDQD
jgi:endogenous inhibitor of DNA gyrase (YacG/DUF329 family)